MGKEPPISRWICIKHELICRHEKLNLFQIKSHDCHVFMQKLIRNAFHELFPPNIWKALIELSLFFKDLTSTVIRTEDMMRLERGIHVILCKLKQLVPPSFFDFMEDLPVHLTYEARITGPVQYRWIHLFSRYKYNLLQFTNHFII